MPTGHRLACAVLALLLPASPAAAQVAFTDPYRNARDDPPPSWTGHVFRLSRDYPKTRPDPEPRPWKKYDPRRKGEARKYLEAVKDYCLEGNIHPDIDWQQHLKAETARRWYHAPWMHGRRDNGREFINGLTRERNSRPYELHEKQTDWFQNWAVSLYNPAGGYVIGWVWKKPDEPDPTAALFPDGTVAVKLLFTAATQDQVPFLKDAKEWDGHTNRKSEPWSIGMDPKLAPRPDEVRKLRLLQLDVAVRDRRVDHTTGWVFGTFVYDGNAPGVTAYHRLVPVGLMWGNDPTVTATHGTRIRQTWRNPHAGYLMTHYGWGRRLNGPVDNLNSSCLSCHSTAEVDQLAVMAPDVPPEHPGFMNWFRNIKAGQPFTPAGTTSLDYSLQLSAGIQNHKVATKQYLLRKSGARYQLVTPDGRTVIPVSREGGKDVELEWYRSLNPKVIDPDAVKPDKKAAAPTGAGDRQTATREVVVTRIAERPMPFTHEGQRAFPVTRDGSPDFDPEDSSQLLVRQREEEGDKPTPPRPPFPTTPFLLWSGVGLLVGAGLTCFALRRRAGR